MRHFASPSPDSVSFISIHAPLTGCDKKGKSRAYQSDNFNPRTPYGMRRSWAWRPNLCRRYFNPRTPYGMRHVKVFHVVVLVIFQSTHPLRDATGTTNTSYSPYAISIHAPLTGCDERLEAYNDDVLIFQSTHPLRDATLPQYSSVLYLSYFNPRTPYGMRLSIF